MPITDVERERAARTLCRKAGYDEDMIFGGQPAWAWYLAQVDAVLEATLSPEELARLRNAEEDS